VSDLSEYSPFFDADDMAGELSPPTDVHVSFWSRAEFPRARETWPELPLQADVETEVREQELANRGLSEEGVARISMVPLTVKRLKDFAASTGADPLDELTRRACAEEIIDEGGTIPWPPPRNSPCWCGSTQKYKKCCGRPNLA
jgi:uncharacterized protein YecA (UPF0149 family)